MGFSLGRAIDASVRKAAETLNSGAAWYPAVTADGDLPEGAWMAIPTDTSDGAVPAWNCRPHTHRFTALFSARRITRFMNKSVDCPEQSP